MERESNSGYFEKAAVAAVIMIAIILRIWGLGASSLTLNESEEALAALGLFANGSHSRLLYSLPTALIFRMFGDSEFTARLFPALTGILLASVPLFLRKQIGERKACLLAFLFAVDPVLLFWSKRADGLIPAVAFFSAAAALWLSGKKKPALGCLFAALSGGDRAVPALVFCLLWGAAVKLIEKCDLQLCSQKALSKKDIGIGTAILLLILTMFGALPGGIGGFITGLFEGFGPAQAWAYPGFSAFAAALIVYSGIPLAFSVVGCIRKRQFKRCGIFAAGMVLFLLWRGMQAMPWVSVFLWFVSADWILAGFDRLRCGRGPRFWAAAGTAVGAYAFFYFRLVEVFNQQNGNAPVQLSWNGVMQTLPLTRTEAAALLTLASVLIILLIVRILLGFSDSEPIRSGILCGFLVIWSWALLTNIWNTGGFDRSGDYPAASHPQNSLLLLNGNYTSLTDTAFPDVLEETIRKHGDRTDTALGLDLITDDPMLDWMLRSHKEVRHASDAGHDLSGYDLILDRTDRSYSENGFVGTVLTYRGTYHWERLSLIEWGKWLIFGDGPTFADPPLTLWVRADYVISND